MHEWGLVSAAAQEVERRSDGAAVRSVTLRLGPGTGDATVRAAWSQLTTRGPLSGAELVIVHDEHRMQCLACGHQYLGHLPEACPDCGGDGLVTVAVADVIVHAWVAEER